MSIINDDTNSFENDGMAPASTTDASSITQDLQSLGIDTSRYQDPVVHPRGEKPTAQTPALRTTAPELAEVLASSGYDPDKYQPPIVHEKSAAPALPAGVRERGYTPTQVEYAIASQSDTRAQIEGFAAVNNLKQAIRAAERMGLPDKQAAEAIHKEIGIPPALIESVKRSGPEEVDAYRAAAAIVAIAGKDSYIYREFSRDPNVAADWRDSAKEIAAVNAAIDSVYGSTGGIMWDWFTGSVANTAVNIVTGIPAYISGMGNAIADMEPTEIRAEEPIPEGLADYDPITARRLEEQNEYLRNRITQRNRLQSNPRQSVIAEERQQLFRDVDEFLQNTHRTAQALVHQPPAATGSMLLDTATRPIVQGLGSYLPSAGLGIIGRGATSLPAWLFGLSEGGESFRDMIAADVNPLTAAMVSLAQSGLSTWAEKTSLDTLFESPGLRGLWRDTAGNSNTFLSRAGRVLGGGLRAGGGEAMAEGVQTGLEVAATPIARAISNGDPWINALYSLQDNAGNILESMWGGFGAGLIGGGTIGNFGREMADTWTYANFQKGLKAVVPEAQRLVERKGDVKKCRDQVRNIIHDSIARNKTNLSATSYADGIDVERYAQSLPPADAESFLQQLGVNRASLRQAVENGLDIEIPTENLLVSEKGTAPEVMAMFRPNPSMPTASFMQQKLAQIEQTFSLAEEAANTIRQDIEKGSVPENIKTFRADLRAMNMSAREADAYTSLLWSWVKTQAESRGVSAEEFSDDRIVRVVMDSVMRNSPEWLRGVLDSRRRNQESQTTEESSNVQPDQQLDGDIDRAIDPAMAEPSADVQEQPGVPDVPVGAAGTEPGRNAAGAVPPGPGGDDGQAGGIQAAESQRALFATEPATGQTGRTADRLTGLPITLETTTTAGVRAAPELFQFKRSADTATGVKRGQEIPGDVDPAAIGTMVFYEDVDGQRFVVSGHHRLDLLRRKGSDEEVRAVILREREGWSTDQARAYGAALNIREGGGDIDDYATFFRETRLDRERAEAEGLLRRENARTGYAIGALGGDNTFYGYLNEELSAHRAAAIAMAAPGDSQLQDMMIARKIKTDELEIFAGYVNKMRNSGALNLSGVQKSLFAGTDYEAMLAQMEKESKAAAREADRLSKQASSLEALARAGKVLSMAEMQRHGVRAGNRAGVTERAAELREEAFQWRNFFQFPDVLAQVQERAGTALPGEQYSQTVQDGDIIFHDVTGKTAPVTIVNTPPWKGKGKQLRTKAREILRSFRGMEIINADTGWDIGFNSKGIGKTVAHKKSQDEYHVIDMLPTLIESAVLVREEGNRKGKESKFYKLVAPVVVRDNLFRAEITIKDGGDNAKKYYLHRLKLVEPAVSNIGSIDAETSIPPTPAGSNYSISRLIGDVNHEVPESFEQSGSSQTRAEIDLYRSDAEHRQAAVIRTMRSANRSTVPHELAHLFLFDMTEWVSSGSASPEANRDFNRLLHWAGRLYMDPTVEKETAEYDRQRQEVTENIEKVARAFEQYLLEGRAPAIDLIDSFTHFSGWLNRIYSSIRQYVGLDLSNNVRGVYDRWLASDRQIREAEAYYRGRRGNTFSNLLNDDEEKRLLEERRERNARRVRSRFAGDMVGAWMDANATSEQVTAESRAEIDAAPAYRAIEAARKSHLDRAGAEAIVGKQTVMDIIDKHGDIFADRSGAAAADIDAIMAREYFVESDRLDAFLRELAAAPSVADAVKAQGSHGRRKRHYQALEALVKAGGIDIELAIDAVGEQAVNRIIDTHGDSLFVSGHTGIERLAAANGFSSGDAMLSAMAKAPNAADLLEDTYQRKMNEKAREARRWATEEVDRLGDAGLHNPDEDIDADTIDITRQAIYEAMNERERRQSAYVERKVIAARAKSHLNKQTLRKAANYSNWGNAERRWATRAAEAAARGNRGAALEALDNQQYYHALVSESFRLRQEEQRFRNRWSYRAARSGLSSVEYGYRQAMMDILHHYGIVKSRDFIPDQSDPNQLLLPREADKLMRKDGKTPVNADIDIFLGDLESFVPLWIKTKSKPDNYKNMRDLTVWQMREMDEVLGMLQKRGRGELTALRDEQTATLEQLKGKLIAEMEKLPDYKVNDPRNWWEKGRRWTEEFVVSNLMIDRIAAEVDGNPMLKGKEMGRMQDLIRQIRSREVDQMQMLEQFREETRADFDILDGFGATLKEQFGSNFFDVDEAEMPFLIQERKGIRTWDADMLLSVFFNMGNRDNLYTLQEGLGLTDKHLAALAGLATEKEWRAVENIGRRIEDFFPALDAVYFRQTNKHLPKVEATPITVETADGKTVTLSGWYYPKVFDPALSSEAAANAEMQDFRASMQAIHHPTKPKDGFTHGRMLDEDGNPVVTQPLLLRSSVLVSHLTDATRWITHAEPLYEFRRLTMDKDFKSLFVKKLGAEKYRYLREWTNRMARPDKEAQGGANRILLKLRNASTLAALGFNITSAFRQTESLGIAADIMSNASRIPGLNAKRRESRLPGERSIPWWHGSGWYWMLQGFKTMGLGGVLGGWVGRGSQATERMFSLSAEADQRAKNVNKEIREMVGKSVPGRRDFTVLGKTLSRDMFFHFTYAMDQGVAGVCWWGAYNQAMNGAAGFDTEGMTEAQIQEKAVIYADTILRSQQSPFQADYTALQADPGAVSLLTQFMGGVTPYFSHSYGMLQMRARGEVSNYAVVRHLVNSYLVPVLISNILVKALWNAAFGDDNEEEKPFSSQLFWGLTNSMFGSVPIARDIVGVAQYGERSAAPPGMSLVGRFVYRSKSGLQKLAAGDVEAAALDFGRAIRDVAPGGQLAKQAWRTGEAAGLIEED